MQEMLWDLSEQLSEPQNFELDKYYSFEEIHTTIFACNASKAPVPDGFS